MSSWIPFEPVPSPLPPNWNNPNVWGPAQVTIGGVLIDGRAILYDHSVVPAAQVSWSTFLGNPRNPNWVPQLDIGSIGCPDGVQATLKMSFQPVSGGQIQYKWAGYATAKIGPAGRGIATGMNYDPGAYPQ